MVISRLISVIDDREFVIFHQIIHMKSMKIECYQWKSMVIDVHVINKDFSVIID